MVGGTVVGGGGGGGAVVVTGGSVVVVVVGSAVVVVVGFSTVVGRVVGESVSTSFVGGSAVPLHPTAVNVIATADAMMRTLLRMFCRLRLSLVGRHRSHGRAARHNPRQRDKLSTIW